MCASALACISTLVPLTGCTSEPTPPKSKPPAVQNVDVEGVLYSGCEAVLRGPRCVYTPGSSTLRLWLPIHPEAPLSLHLDGEAQPVAFEPAEHGQRTSLALDGTHTLLEVVGQTGVVWSISLRVQNFQIPEVVQQTKSLAKTDLPGAITRLQNEVANLAPRGRAHALRTLGEFAFRQGKYRDALASNLACYQLASEEGLLRMASEVALVSAYTCVLLHDLDGANAWLRRSEVLLSEYPPGHLVHAYYRGLVAKREGDLRQALLDYRAHASYSAKLGQAQDVVAARAEEGVLRGNLGDFRGAVKAYEQATALSGSIPAPHRGALLNNRAWTRIEARARGRDIGDPLPLLHESLAIYGPEGAAPDPRAVVEIKLNLAYAHVLAHDAERAAAHLPEAGQTQGARQSLWRGLIAAEIAALRAEHVRATNQFAQLSTLAAAVRDPYLEWYFEVRQAELQVALGNSDQALAHYRAAEQQLDQQLAQIAVDAGREHFLADRARSSWGLVELLLDRDEVAEAACVARLARARTYRPLRQRYDNNEVSPDVRLQQRQALASFRATRAEVDREYERSWSLSRQAGETLRAQLAVRLRNASHILDLAYTSTQDGPIRGPTCEQLRPPEAGELLLLYYPRASGWVGFAVSPTAVTAHYIEPVDLEASHADISKQLLEPFGEQIHAALRLRLIPTRELLQVDFHALPFRDGPLLSHAPVAYALDLLQGYRERLDIAPHPAKRAAIIAPPSNLAAAADEVIFVEDTLNTHDWEVDTIVQAEATLPTVREALLGAGLMHFVGHARGDGLSGWDSTLELAGDSTLGVADILALEGPAPTTVVLNGCETGITDPETLGGGMSLALAFLLAGSQAVIATGAEVDDAASAAWVRKLYARFEPSAGYDHDGALDAARLLRASWSQQQVGPYRVWVP